VSEQPPPPSQDVPAPIGAQDRPEEPTASEPPATEPVAPGRAPPAQAPPPVSPPPAFAVHSEPQPPPPAEPEPTQRPELAAGAAFAGGFLVAMILRRLAR
jgi:hypothetical protein